VFIECPVHSSLLVILHIQLYVAHQGFGPEVVTEMIRALVPMLLGGQVGLYDFGRFYHEIGARDINSGDHLVSSCGPFGNASHLFGFGQRCEVLESQVVIIISVSSIVKHIVFRTLILLLIIIP
jgi:hypothetical protein